MFYIVGVGVGVGVAIVLYARPQIMFREDGMWKEFGLATESLATETNQTIFRFGCLPWYGPFYSMHLQVSCRYSLPP